MNIKSVRLVVVSLLVTWLLSGPAFADLASGNGSGGGGSGGGGSLTASYPAATPSLSPGQSASLQVTQKGELVVGPQVLNIPSPIPVTAAAWAHTYAGGTVTVGNTAQTWAASGAIHNGCFFYNTSSNNLYLRGDGANATTASYPVLPGGSVSCSFLGIPLAGFSLLGTVTGQTFTGEYW